MEVLQVCVTLEGNINTFIFWFTTAYTCLELYSLLDALQDRCLYHDTDCDIREFSGGNWNPLLGDYLGKLITELPPDEHIMDFVSSGPISYNYLQSGGKCCVKVKGITLNAINREKINFEVLNDLVLDYGMKPDSDIPKKQW